MTEHTPGPWTWGENFDGLYGSGKDNEVLTYVAYENMWLSFGHSREANARLIAAAPDLLEALKALVEYNSKDNAGQSLLDVDDLWIAAVGAIDKATGRL